MARVSPIQNSFNAGELSPLLAARVDFNKRANGCEVMLGYVPTIQGPAQRLPGKYFVAEAKDSSKATRIISFEFSTTQAYIIEIGDLYMRFYMNNGQILSGATAYEIATPYVEADIFDLQFTQSADVLFIAHSNYAPRELIRTSSTSWTLTETVFKDGPYLPINTSTTTFTPSAASGVVTVTASAITGINNDTGFQPTDVGRVMRVSTGSGWAWGTITAVADTLNVTVSIDTSATFPTTATADWYLGLWSATTGYPSAVAFFQNRLWYGGNAAYPNRVDGSRSGDYNNFAATELDGTVVDSNAVSTQVLSRKVNKVQWLDESDQGLAMGTTGAPYLVRPSSQNQVLTPTNIKADRVLAKGAAPVQTIHAGVSILYVQRAKQKLLELSYSLNSNNYKSTNVTLLAEHITTPGITQTAYQEEPYSIIWAVRSDGTLLGFTYDKDEAVEGWHRHIIGGVSDANGTQAKVESIAVIPSPDGTYDQLWLVTQRYINGTVKRYVEYMMPYWKTGNSQSDAFYVDCGLTYNGAATTSISGLDHLEGETVTILADGAKHPSQVVTGGAIALNYAASKVQVGLSYVSDLGSLSIEAGSQDGTPVGKKKRINRLTVKVQDTLGLKLGPDANSLVEHPFRNTTDPMGSAPPLFSGDVDISWNGGYTTQAKVYLRQDGPFPGTILSFVPAMTEMDR